MGEFGEMRKILVPLAGKTVRGGTTTHILRGTAKAVYTTPPAVKVDIPFLAYANHDVVGVELVEQAVHELADEHDLQLSRMPEPLPGKSGTDVLFEKHSIHVFTESLSCLLMLRAPKCVHWELWR